MRLVTVPEDIMLMDHIANRPIMDGSSPVVFSMFRFLLQMVFADPEFAKDRKDRKAIHVIRKKFSEVRGGDVVELEDDHWERLKRMVETYKPTMVPLIMEQLTDFEEAVINAKEKT